MSQPHRTKPPSSLQSLHHTESNYDAHSATVAGQPPAAAADLGDTDPNLLDMTGAQNPRRPSHSPSLENPWESQPPSHTRQLSNPDHFPPHSPLHPNGVLDTDGTPLLDSIDHLPDMTASRGFGFGAALTPQSPSGGLEFFDYFRPMAEDNNRSPWMDAFTHLPPDNHREGTPAGRNYHGSLSGGNQFRSSLQTSGGLNGFETPQRESRHREMDILNIKNECIARMGKLNRGLLQEVGLVNSGKVAGTLLFSQASRSAYLEVEKGRQGGQNYVIGRMLHSAKELLDILNRLERCKGTLFPLGSTEPTIRTADETTTAMAETTTLNQTGSHPPSSPLGGNPLSPLLGPSSASTSHSASHSSSSSSTPSPCPANNSLDTTLTLLFLTGYTSVIQLYRGVFSFIHDSLVANPSGSNFLPTLPNLQVDGLEVGSSTRDLQICILLQVSTHMLNQIEDRLHAIRDRTEGHVPAALLDTILDRSDPSQRGAKGKELCQIVRDIKKCLRHHAE